jgi:hypothetical protein
MIRYDFDVISDPQPPKPVRPPQAAEAKPPGQGEGARVPEPEAGKQPAVTDPPARADPGQ